MDQNSKMKILANDLIRRLLNTSEAMGMEERVKIVDHYSQKLINSGYSLEQVQKIIINGIKGYERRRKEDRDGSRMLHRTAGQSAGLRSRKKLLDKSEWFKTKRGLKSKDDMREEEDVPGPGGGCELACSEVERKEDPGKIIRSSKVVRASPRGLM